MEITTQALTFNGTSPSLPPLFLSLPILPHLYPLLVTDFPSNVRPGVEVDGRNEERKPTETAAIPNSLCVLPKDVAGAKIGNDA